MISRDELNGHPEIFRMLKGRLYVCVCCPSSIPSVLYTVIVMYLYHVYFSLSPYVPMSTALPEDYLNRSSLYILFHILYFPLHFISKEPMPLIKIRQLFLLSSELLLLSIVLTLSLKLLHHFRETVCPLRPQLLFNIAPCLGGGYLFAF